MAGPNPPWEVTKVDNGAKYRLNEQPANEPPVTERYLYIIAADGAKLTVNLANGSVSLGIDKDGDW